MNLFDLSSHDLTVHLGMQGIPPEGVEVISGFLHSHLAGRKIRLRHIRGGKELEPLLQDNHYDFNYQAPREPTSGNRIMPGDDLLLECEYETLDRENATYGGKTVC